MITIDSVAKTFLNMESMSPKKLQKLCFYAYSWYLTHTGRQLFENKFEAWIHGPVDPELYHQFKEHGRSPIPREEKIPSEVSNDPFVYEFVELIYQAYGSLDGDQLEELTHSQAPWLNARKGLLSYEPSKNSILDEDIINYHKQELVNV
ncbi:hypothetical protein CGZ75_01560 [Paenibacillus herberti]|uniref:Antitoxin SocA-like Panacea domain-containing protein n=2 Tax=Paenibacillus herberti TaxID=1619309 RepID=A0A229P615_9BACL|nr:hypothetical protein CGZ75_01560 [Paenibacillus herberti]